MTKSCTVPRGIRLNNPGNIKESPGDKTQWQGERATDDDPVFEEFVSPEAGIRALTRILLGYQRRYGLNTVAGIINRWAPGCENDTDSYIAHVASRLGVTPDQAIDVTRPEVMAGLVEAIIRHENGQQPYSREVILAGVGHGLGEGLTVKLLDLLGDAAAIAANPVVGLAKVALDVAPDIAALFGDDAEKAVGKLADTVRAITGTDDPDKAREALADPNLVFQLRSQAQAFAHEERMQQMANAVTTLTATLADRQNARARDAEFIKSGRSNTRANVLLVTAGAGIVGGIGFMVFGHVDGNTAVGGCIISVVTLLAGKFATAFDFEFGGSADSEQTRSLLAQAPPIGK